VQGLTDHSPPGHAYITAVVYKLWIIHVVSSCEQVNTTNWASKAKIGHTPSLEKTTPDKGG